MSDQAFEKTIHVPRPAAAVFALITNPCAYIEVLPGVEGYHLKSAPPSLGLGSRIVLESRSKPGSQWILECTHHDLDTEIRLKQVQGPFASFTHTRKVTSNGAGGATLTDAVIYRPYSVVGSRIQEQFSCRFARMHEHVLHQAALAQRYGAVRRLRVMIAGASGMVGQALTQFLRAQGHDVVALVRGRKPSADEVAWDPAAGTLDPHSLRGVDVVVNLAGENIASKKWTEERRQEIRDSRVKATRTLVSAMSHAKHRPYLFISASAIGAYGNSGDVRVYEDSRTGAGFLAQVCDAWEEEAERAVDLGIRTSIVRIATVLAEEGGALPRMLLPFRLGFGGPVGPRENWMSWISLADLVGVIYHCMIDVRCTGVINAVAPGALRQHEWARALGGVLDRPSWLPVPAWALKLVFGAMAEETILTSVRAQPGVLQQAGFSFRHPNVQAALRYALGKPSPKADAEVKPIPTQSRRRRA